MSVKQSVNWLSQQRVDIPDLKAIDQSVIFDFTTLIKFFAGNNPYILQGFTIPVSGISGPATSLQMVSQNAMVWIPGNLNGAFLQVPSGTPNDVLNSANPNVVGSFSPGANYIGIQFNRATDPSTADLVNLWDVDSQSEFTETVARGYVMNYQIVISNTNFGATAPVAIVNVSGSNVTSIENCKYSPWRLGQGGANPNPNYSHVFSPAIENPLLATSNSSPDPFTGGDWDLLVFKDWADAVMTALKQIIGGAFWYLTPGSSLVPNVNLSDLYMDAAGSVVTGAGTFQSSEVTPGLLTWTSTLNIRYLLGPLTLTIPAGSVTLLDTEVAYIDIVRNQDFQPANTFTFTNGSAVVSASLPVTGIAAGDWIMYVSDNVTDWAQVEMVAGTTITLTANYFGSSASGKALRTQGSYTMQIALPQNMPATSNVFWIAKRDDNAVPVATIAAPSASGLTRTTNEATVTTTAPHNLSVGETVGIAGTSDASFSGVFDIDTIPTTTSFTIPNPGPDVAAGIAGNGSVTVRAKIYLRALGLLAQGSSRPIDDVTVENILKFIGSPSESATTPPYTILPSLLCPFPFTMNSNLTQAISAAQGNINALYEQLTDPSYDEPLVVITEAPVDDNHIQGPISSGSTLTLPLNTRAAFAPQFYTVGKGYLQVYLNGQMLNQNNPFSGVPVSIIDYNINSGSPTLNLFTPTTAIAIQFTPGQNYGLTQTQFSMLTAGNPAGNLMGQVYSNSGGIPGTLLGSSVVVPASNVGSTATIVDFNFSSPVPLTASTPYWFIITGDSTYQSNVTPNYVSVLTQGTSYTVAEYNSGTWMVVGANTPVFQLVGTVTGPADGAIINGWNEVGSQGSLSNEIIIQQNLYPEDVVTFRIGVLGGPGGGAGGGGGTITGAVGLPVGPFSPGAGANLVYGVSGSNIVIKSLTAGSNITVTDNGAGGVAIASTGGGGGGLLPVTSYSSNQLLNIVTDSIVEVDCTAGPVTITLPASGAQGKIFYISKIDSSGNACTVNGNGNLINGVSTFVLPGQYDEVTVAGVLSNNWRIL